MKKVITYGSFDLFHEGHYRLLQRAKALGDYLIVGVTTESYDESRGKQNVVDPIMERIEHVRQTGFVDEVIIEDHVGQKIEDIQRLGIDIFTVGSDWVGVFDYLKAYCQVVYLERTKGISSTMLRAKNYGIVRMGVIGTGRIAHRFIPEARYVSGSNVESVYHPKLEKAQAYAEKFELNHCYDDLDRFLDSVDAVYIASPHETHGEYMEKALLHKKHVLCEKPMFLAKDEAERLFALAKEKGCVLMEGIKTAYCPGFIQLLGIVRSGVIGEVRDVEACFTKLEKPDSRELNDPIYGGSFTELASYPLLAIVKILGKEYQDIRFEVFRNEKGIDVYTKAYLRYEDSVATVKVGLGVKSEGQLLVSGTRGYILAEAPWWKTRAFETRFEDNSLNEKYFSKYLGDGLRYELSNFVTMINGTNKKSDRLPGDESIWIAETMERFLEEEKRRWSRK